MKPFKKLPKINATRMALALWAVLCANGCAPFQAKPVPQVAQTDTVPLGVSVAIDNAMHRATVQKNLTLSAQKPADLGVSPGQTLNLRWEGEAGLILEKIARQQNLKYRVTGTQPYLPLPVFITLRSVTLLEAMQAIGDQLGGRATVVLHDDTLELKMN